MNLKLNKWKLMIAFMYWLNTFIKAKSWEYATSIQTQAIFYIQQSNHISKTTANTYYNVRLYYRSIEHLSLNRLSRIEHRTGDIWKIWDIFCVCFSLRSYFQSLAITMYWHSKIMHAQHLTLYLLTRKTFKFECKLKCVPVM